MFAIDDPYVQPLCVALVSLWEAEGHELSGLHVVVLHETLTASGQTAIERLARTLGLDVDFLQVSSEASHRPVTEWWSSAMYLRLAIPDLLPTDQVALYLDADTLILHSLGPLLATDVSDVCLAAVRDPLNPILSGGTALPGWRELGLDGSTEYFNSGVMLMNLERFRNEGLGDRCWAFLDQRRSYARFWDQDTLNVVVADRWRRLDRRWNTFPVSAMFALPGEKYVAEEVLPSSTLLADESTAAVMHFAGSVKPWGEAFPAGLARVAYERFSEKTRDLLAGS